MAEDYLAINRAAWDARAELHFDSAFYDVPGFLAGASSLREIELAELGDVAGKRLLHLQCHFGLDTLSWARLGAHCTGVDLSPVAIGKARELQRAADLPAQFICSDVYGFQRSTPEPFDIVYTSYGTVGWLPDLDRWARVIAGNLARGGTFYIADFHPLYDLLAGYRYFAHAAPDIETEGSYTENSGELSTPLANWSHPMSEIVNALLGAGLVIQRLNEYPFSPYNCFEGLVEREPGRFYLEHRGHEAPLVFTITATR
ncbi:class I SAM-dependent methyltransferase [Mangrovimicrobium sediminis]|uniref:Class I SAM-dependent methyltransferase n=1 Tax=Mangrovimicrobium sediminis TaxID=2562682 RepID=A0A4Z0LXB7_9GAMM|nr:class I SAM-dependent methyltransferase [Haliea sp. SAOS-164]TGD71787.1 class I SAM-dependent methyltransferase [Haliea sp. SAOS-164]